VSALACRLPPPRRRAARRLRCSPCRDAKKIEEIKYKDPESGEELETGLVRVKAALQTAGGGKIDVGGGGGAAAAFGGGEKAEADDDGGDDGGDAEVTKLDQFWTFPSIENEQTYPSFKDLQKNLIMPCVWPCGGGGARAARGVRARASVRARLCARTPVRSRAP